MTNLCSFKVDKLIRDKLPELMRESGIQVFEYIMEQDEYIKRLKDKLLEEANEVVVATNKNEILEELADVLEVLMAIASVNEMSFVDIVKVAEQKRSYKGGFEKRIYNACVKMPSNNPSVKYYRSQSDRYPEIK